MLRTVGYGTKLVREFNELNLLRFIKEYGQISRAQLSQKYQISKATVSEIVAKLIKSGFVREIGMGTSSKLGGRKPILLEFNPKSGYAIGIEIKRDHARIALSDLNANIEMIEMITYQQTDRLEQIIAQIIVIIKRYLQEGWVKKSRAVGIGVSIPGLINYSKGCILESDSLKSWEGVEVKRIFENEFGIETTVENDVKAITFGEFRFGNGGRHNNLIYLWVGDGIGAGIIIRGELYRGVSASAGEIGFYELGYYIQNQEEFKLLKNDHKTFGDILSEKVLVQAALRGIKNGYETKLRCESCSVIKIMKAADQNDPLALELLREYASVIGVMCINLINTINPEILLIGGESLAYNNRLMGFILERIKKDALHTPIAAVSVKNAALKENAGVLGSIGLVLDDIFYSDQLNLERYRLIFNN